MNSVHPESGGAGPAAAGLAEAFDELASRLQAGEAVGREELWRRYPEHAAELLRLLPALAALDDLSNGDGPAAAPGDLVAEQPLGDFRVLREVGRGGMGIVYEAVQMSLGRRVALKVLPFAGALDAKQLRRFKNESQAAAHLQHQHIVPVHFVGCERGVHFYAMQYIDGQTLAQLIAEMRRSAGEEPTPAPADRPPSADADRSVPRPPLVGDVTSPYGPLALPGSVPRAPDTVPQAGLATERSHRTAGYFKAVARLGVQAAEALHHAHEMGVIHRDVKPGNLLVDGRGSLWVTDFGLAHVQSEASLTLSGDLVGTVRYMSPEQALASRVLIDHRTDVYSLGATLYELLTLRPAFRGNDRQGLLRQIAFDEPVRPSRINREVPGELETVVLKAVEKRPEDRYQTAEELAEDLRRVLRDEPIRARRPTAVQRLRKWCRRHQGVVRVTAVSAAVFMVLLAAAAAVAIWLAVRATEAEGRALAERDRADKQAAIAKEQAAIASEVNEFLQDDLLGQASSWAQADRKFTAQPNLTVREALDRAAQQMGNRFRKRPLVEAAIRLAIGDAYRGVGNPRTAIEHLQQSLTLRRGQLGPDHPDTLTCMNDLAIAYLDAGQLQRAVTLHEQALAKGKERLGLDHPHTLIFMNNLALAYLHAGQVHKAIALQEQALAKQTHKLGPDHPGTIRSMNNLAEAYLGAGQIGKAIALHEQALAKHKEKLGPDHPDTLSGMNNLAIAYLAAGQVRRAMMLHQQTLAKMKEKLGPNHPHTLRCMGNLAVEYQRAGNPGKAVALHEEVLAKVNKQLGPDHLDTLTSMENLADAYWDAVRLGKALPLFEQVLAKRKDKLGPDHPHTLLSMNNLANAYSNAGQLDKALPLFERALAKQKARLGLGHPDTLNTMDSLAGGYQRAGQVQKAITLYEQTLAKQKQKLGPDHPDTLNTMKHLATAYQDAGQVHKAIGLHEQALAKQKEKLGLDHHDTLISMNDLAVAYHKAGQLGKALALYEQVLVKRKDKFGRDHPETLTCMSNLGNGYLTTGQVHRAVALLEQVLALQKEKLGADHPNSLTSMNSLACAYRDAGQIDKAIALHEQALTKMKEKLGPDHPDTLNSMDNLANAYRIAGQSGKATALHEQALAKFKATLGAEHPRTLVCTSRLARSLAQCDDPRLHDPARAVQLARTATNLAAKLNRDRGRFGNELGKFWSTLGVARYRAGDKKGALEALDRSMQLQKGGDSADWFFAAMAHWQLSDKNQARKWYDRAVRWMEKNRPKDKELRRFRREAAALLGVKESTADQGKEKLNGKK
jgi:serine/threonine protein kinase/Tfp pilus assembly protein PilF